MSKRRSGRTVSAYMGVEASTPPQFVGHQANPTADNYSNFNIGTIWLNNTTQFQDPPVSPTGSDLWMLVLKKERVATWVKFAGVTSTLTGDTGGPVSADELDNVNVLGGSGIETTGNPGINTITWDVDGTVPITWQADSGSAVAQNNILNIVGGFEIETSGATDTLTISVTDVVATQYTADIGTAVPNSNNLNVVGGTGVATAGAADTITSDISGDVAVTYTADIGSATAVANNINIIGSSSASTSAAASTVTINSAISSAPSAFLVDLSADIPNILGFNDFGYPNPPYVTSRFVIPFDRTYFDINSDYDASQWAFVAPVDGFYTFQASGAASVINTASFVSYLLRFLKKPISGATTATWGNNRHNCFRLRDGSDRLQFSAHASIPMEAGDLVFVSLGIIGNSRTATCYAGGTTPSSCWFSGYRVN